MTKSPTAPAENPASGAAEAPAVQPDLSDNPERRDEREAVQGQTQRTLFEQGTLLPPSPEKDQILRTGVIRAARQNRPAVLRAMYADGAQQFLESSGDLLDAMEDQGLDPRYLQTSKRNLNTIVRYATVPADPSKSGFDIVRYAEEVGKELTRVRQHRDMLRGTGLGDNDQRLQALRMQETYLQRLLDLHGIPHGENLMGAFDLHGRKIPSKHDQKVWGEAKSLALLGGGVICGAYALLNAIIAIKANPKDPNLLAAAIWASPLVLYKLLDKSDPLAQELSFMQNTSFTGYAEKHGNGIAGPVRSLLDNPARGGAKRLLVQLRDGTPAKKAEARERLADLLTDGEKGREAQVNGMLENPKELADFLLPILTHPRSETAKEVTLKYLEKARAPRSSMVRPLR